jgi:hypothetical protein
MTSSSEQTIEPSSPTAQARSDSKSAPNSPESDSDGLETGKEDVFLTLFLEKLAVFTYVFAFVIAPFVSMALTIFIVLYPIFWPFAIPYFIWYAYDWHTPRRGSRAWLAFRRVRFWNHLADYFPMRLVKTAELPPDRNYVIG